MIISHGPGKRSVNFVNMPHTHTHARGSAHEMSAIGGPLSCAGRIISLVYTLKGPSLLAISFICAHRKGGCEHVSSSIVKEAFNFKPGHVTIFGSQHSVHIEGTICLMRDRDLKLYLRLLMVCVHFTQCTLFSVVGCLISFGSFLTERSKDFLADHLNFQKPGQELPALHSEVAFCLLQYFTRIEFENQALIIITSGLLPDTLNVKMNHAGLQFFSVKFPVTRSSMAVFII